MTCSMLRHASDDARPSCPRCSPAPGMRPGGNDIGIAADGSAIPPRNGACCMCGGGGGASSSAWSSSGSLS
ncbi:hypothetical protein EJB05_47603 [Eragrostis curvula]|uniref:Uncharacterized protein n=1 Tax=Eragrostis curvula TaxID=38414 RepID=A0A5J9SZP5_9POAL|nr:hypothetical protein EJB05_47603 [Eragrostis curvula]